MKPTAANERSTFRVGELATATGVTVRTLHHYEEAGLLRSCGRTDGGHRMFDSGGVKRIHQIRALRALGLSLAEIGEVLDDGAPMTSVFSSHLAEIEQEIERLQLVRDRLRGLTSRGRVSTDVDELVLTLDAMSRIERHARTQRRAQAPASDGAAEAWRVVGRELRACMEAGCAADDERTIRVASRARALILRFANGDERVLSALARLRSTSPPRDLAGWDAELVLYLDAALARLPDRFLTEASGG